MTEFRKNPFAFVQEYLTPYTFTQGELAFRELLGNMKRAGFTVRTVRGRKMHDKSGLFDEFSAAFQFPAHFGENWDAFYDCISDLEWLAPGHGYVIVILEPEELLMDAPTDELMVFLDTLKQSSADFSSAVENDGTRSESIPFHVLVVPEATVSRRLDQWEQIIGKSFQPLS